MNIEENKREDSQNTDILYKTNQSDFLEEYYGALRRGEPATDSEEISQHYYLKNKMQNSGVPATYGSNNLPGHMQITDNSYSKSPRAL